MPKKATIEGDMSLEDLQAELLGTDPALGAALAAAESRQQDWHDGYHARLAEVRKARELTQVSLARMMHISQPSVAEMERKPTCCCRRSGLHRGHGRRAAPGGHLPRRTQRGHH